MIEGENGRLLEVTPLDFLEAVYCNPNLPLAQRMRAAIEAAPYRHSKLSTTANINIDGTKSFADALERACLRSEAARNGLPALLNGPSPEIDATVLKRPFQTYRRF